MEKPRIVDMKFKSSKSKFKKNCKNSIDGQHVWIEQTSYQDHGVMYGYFFSHYRCAGCEKVKRAER